MVAGSLKVSTGKQLYCCALNSVSGFTSENTFDSSANRLTT